VHGIENLFLASSSVFPTSGQANSTYLAVAFALRLANYLTGSAVGENRSAATAGVPELIEASDMLGARFRS
jgi:choline dehydrogenase-like flavoprotein